jgi:hypothetical protein
MRMPQEERKDATSAPVCDFEDTLANLSLGLGLVLRVL